MALLDFTADVLRQLKIEGRFLRIPVLILSA